VRDDGYLVEHNGKCITVFSAPNYCDQMGNKGGVVRLVRRLGGGAQGRVLDASETVDPQSYTLAHPNLINFTAVPHPPVKPMAYATGMAGVFGL
jgi:serine/threonine-protein phosphatase 5